MNAEETYNELVAEVDPTLHTQPVIERDDSDGVEYLDGVTVESNLYVADETFSIKDFDTTVRKVSLVSSTLFRDIMDEHGIDLSQGEGSSDEDVPEGNARAFN